MNERDEATGCGGVASYNDSNARSMDIKTDDTLLPSPGCYIPTPTEQDTILCFICQTEITGNDREELDMESWRRLSKFDCSISTKRVLHMSCFKKYGEHSYQEEVTAVNETVSGLNVVFYHLSDLIIIDTPGFCDRAHSSYGIQNVLNSLPAREFIILPKPKSAREVRLYHKKKLLREKRMMSVAQRQKNNKNGMRHQRKNMIRERRK